MINLMPGNDIRRTLTAALERLLVRLELISDRMITDAGLAIVQSAVKHERIEYMAHRPVKALLG